jgi:hypothetical protein
MKCLAAPAYSTMPEAVLQAQDILHALDSGLWACDDGPGEGCHNRRQQCSTRESCDKAIVTVARLLHVAVHLVSQSYAVDKKVSQCWVEVSKGTARIDYRTPQG